MALLVVVVTAGSWLLMPGREAGTGTPVPMVDAPQIAIQVNLAPSELVLPEDFVVAIPHNSPYFAVASRSPGGIREDAETLLADYRVDRALLESGAMDVDTFAGRLANLELRWWNVTYRMLEDAEFGDLALLEFRATLLAGHAIGALFCPDMPRALPTAITSKLPSPSMSCRAPRS